ncbi:MAG: MBL fold metallo-hydrolase [Clostridia bacterium]|nr:MBL fold metallo-hydrolase [Clostridia bacterium]
MYELIQVTNTAYYVNCPAKIGIVKTGETDVVLIDSGNDKDAGKKVLRILNENGWTLRAIYNTHSHADHIGANKYLTDQTGCAVYAPGTECDFTNHTFLEPAALYGGFPMKDLRHKFLMAQESPALPLEKAPLPDNMKIIPLPGHSFDMVGFETQDGAVFLADCLSSQETLEKYGIGYIWDVAAYLETLEKVKGMSAKCFIPSHAEQTDNIAPLAQYNIDAVNKTAENILSFCKTPVTFDTLLKKLFDLYGLQMSIQQYALIGSTLRSYLAMLTDCGKIKYTFENNTMMWGELI